MTNRFYFVLAALVVFNVSHDSETNSIGAPVSIVITEILPDPNPSVGLPLYEFIELTNTGTDPVNLMGYAISDGSSVGIINRNYLLLPDSILILCTSAAFPHFEKWGKTLAVSGLPSLNNEEDTLLLFNPDRQLVQTIAYSTEWYRNTLKAAGGWSLEMIDLTQPCLQAVNWSSSIHPGGGTPGHSNSIKGIASDTTAPTIRAVYATDSLHIRVVFDEPVDSLSSATIDRYQADSLVISQVHAIAPLYQEVQLKLAQPMQAGKIYRMTVEGIGDCSGNTIRLPLSASVGLASQPLPGELLINEILFDPPPGGKDFIELYNHSGKVINLNDCWLANRDEAGFLKNMIPASSTPLLLFPGQWIALSEDSLFIRTCFRPPSFARLAKTTLPSLPADKGTVVLLDRSGKVIEELSYEDSWHFKLIMIRKGVSLERISYDQPAGFKENWTSASSLSGFGTPGYENSQHQAGGGIATIEIFPPSFSPNLDGQDDFCLLDYQFGMAGYMATVEIYDIHGKRVKILLNNQLVGKSGRLRWDGLDESGRVVAQGLYIILFRAFHLSGKNLTWKGAVVKTG